MKRNKLTKQTRLFQEAAQAVEQHRRIVGLPLSEVQADRLYYVVAVNGLPTITEKKEGMNFFGAELLEILKH